MTRLFLARLCRLLARLGIAWGDRWVALAERLEGKPVAPKQPVRGIGA